MGELRQEWVCTRFQQRMILRNAEDCIEVDSTPFPYLDTTRKVSHEGL